MKDLLIRGASALALTTLLGAAGCNQQQPQEKVVERVVVHDQPVVVQQDGDHREGDRRDAGQTADRRDSPPPDQPPNDRPVGHPGDRPGVPQDNHH